MWFRPCFQPLCSTAVPTDPASKPAKGGGKALLAFAGVCVLGLISVPLWKLILITFTANHLISEGDVAVK